MPPQVSEQERVDAAVEDAVDAVEEGDPLPVAAVWAAEKNDVHHRAADVHDRVHQEVFGDDGA